MATKKTIIKTQRAYGTNKKEKKRNGKNEKHPIIAYQRTVSQKFSDKLTNFVGSWTFIILVLIFLAIWIYINIKAANNGWDPYPFILLNFFLSCLAALQAPIILMSQNRQASRDRLQAKYDYEIDRKSARGIEKIQKEVASLRRLIKKMEK
jgi:CRP/FNR family transcriptional regulator, cyclic AMP receptor protein